MNNLPQMQKSLFDFPLGKKCFSIKFQKIKSNYYVEEPVGLHFIRLKEEEAGGGGGGGGAGEKNPTQQI